MGQSSGSATKAASLFPSLLSPQVSEGQPRDPRPPEREEGETLTAWVLGSTQFDALELKISHWKKKWEKLATGGWDTVVSDTEDKLGLMARVCRPGPTLARHLPCVPQAAQWGRAVGPEPQRTRGRQSESRPGGAAAARLLTGTQSEAHGQSEPKAQQDLRRL